MTTTPMIFIYYSCAICKTVERRVDVPARLDPDATNVDAWIADVVAAITRDHQRRNPGCWSKKIRNLRIPLPNRDDPGAWVGMPMTEADAAKWVASPPHIPDDDEKEPPR